MADDGILAALPEDVLLQVVSRVGDVKSLFMLAVTCRRWLRRFTDRAFLRDLFGQRAGDVLGFFVQLQLQRDSVSALAGAAFLPAPRLPLRPFTSSNHAEPLAARRGILLMRLGPRTQWAATSHHLALCNPITSEQHILPHLEDFGLGRYAVTSCAIITAADIISDDLAGKQPSSSGRFTFSQLLVTTRHMDGRILYLHSYSAATRSWSAPAAFLDLNRFYLVDKSSSSSAVVHRGAAHWLCTDAVACPTRGDELYKLSVEVGSTDTATTRISMTRLPFRAVGTPLLCVGGDGELTIACVLPMHVRVWTQQQQDRDGDGGDAAWLRSVIRPPLPSAYPDCAPLMHDLRKGSVLMMYSRSGGVFVLDLEKKTMEKVMDCFLPLRIGAPLNRVPVPYEMDLVEFFQLQLGGLRGGGLQDN